MTNSGMLANSDFLFLTVASVVCASLAPAQPAASLKLEPMLEITNANGLLAVVAPIARDGKLPSMTPKILFRAVTGAQWPDTVRWHEGLVPVFAVEKEDSFELRRLPARGVENSSEPLFFALPREDEPNATNIAGRWECVATNSEGTKHYVAWELAVDGPRVAGRLDQQTDYRFAFVTGGSFQSNRIEFTVEYINDRYTIAGEWRGGGIGGRWKRDDGIDHGSFLATRPSPEGSPPDPPGAVPLYEWRRKDGRQRRYSTDATWNAQGWERSTLPLCRVWKAE